MEIIRHKTVLTIMLTTAFTFACASPASPAPMTATPTMASTAAHPNINGAYVRVLGLWSGPELDSFITVKAAWEKDSSGIVDWEGPRICLTF